MLNTFTSDFIKESVEGNVFPNEHAQSFFIERCRINDSILPRFIDREEWHKRNNQDVLEANDSGGWDLYLPKDIKLREMIDIIKMVDQNTFVKKPEKANERIQKIQELAKIFEKAWLYIASYLDIIEEKDWKQIADDMSREFYQYGLSLQNREKKEDEMPHWVKFSDEEKAELDEWLLGSEVYQKSMSRLWENISEEQKENERKRLLKVFFKALAREWYRWSGEKPWERVQWPVSRLQDNTKEAIVRAIGTPRREMDTAIFNRWGEVVKNVESSLLLPKNNSQYKWKDGSSDIDELLNELDIFDIRGSIWNKLGVEKLKQQLDAIRETWDLVMLSAKELEIAKKVCSEVSSLSYSSGLNNPSDIVKTSHINCLGASILWGAILDDLGIKYLAANLLRHSSTVLLTSEGRYYWQDFTPHESVLEENYMEITQDMIDSGNLTEGGDITFKDFNPYTNVWDKLSVHLSRPKIGLKLSLLNNTGNKLIGLKEYEEAIVALKKILELNPNSYRHYVYLWNIYREQGKYEEAIELLWRAIKIDPQEVDAYIVLWTIYKEEKRYAEAIELLEGAIKIDPNYEGVYTMLIEIYKEQKDYQHAISFLMQTSKNHITDEYLKDVIMIDIYELMGMFHYDKKNYKRAIEFYEKAIKQYSEMYKFYCKVESRFTEEDDFEGLLYIMSKLKYLMTRSPSVDKLKISLLSIHIKYWFQKMRNWFGQLGGWAYWEQL